MGVVPIWPRLSFLTFAILRLLDVAKSGAKCMQLSPVEWHLVRDGKPFGPLSELEFLKFIELGHLEQNDLLWRDGFSEWRSASVVFPELREVLIPSHAEPLDCSIAVGEPLVAAMPVSRRATSRKALVLGLFTIVVLGGAVSYGYFSSDWLLPETASFLARFLAL
jgi:GYF domain 2